ncbi:MAG: 6-pyruvoyl tetrahydrobiopterin synthase [Bacteroidetes bacterium]|jgi:6-pyruvoyltetrahydropterin/6-carboxytetrahydropterin synthase|nr:6-pyruvoyl tetrahydrobiopterin synthase [Bacteroidota bacterium]MDF2452713.1 6-pyruvoyl tetrahydrobiopterin synthase [Bacteroidota bacterium]
MIYITRKEHFNAAHKLFNPAWTEEQNNTTFGKCANKNWHGHNYELFVTVKGEINPDTGFVVNLKTLSTVIRTDVTDILDHKNLNMDVKGMPIMPSTENVAIFIWNILAPKIKEMGAELHGIKLYETDSNYVEYFGG